MQLRVWESVLFGKGQNLLGNLITQGPPCRHAPSLCLTARTSLKSWIHHYIYTPGGKDNCSSILPREFVFTLRVSNLMWWKRVQDVTGLKIGSSKKEFFISKMYLLIDELKTMGVFINWPERQGKGQFSKPLNFHMPRKWNDFIYLWIYVLLIHVWLRGPWSVVNAITPATRPLNIICRSGECVRLSADIVFFHDQIITSQYEKKCPFIAPPLELNVFSWCVRCFNVNSVWEKWKCEKLIIFRSI